MRIVLVVDSACDLPKEFIERHDIEILPIAVRIDGTTEVDYRDQAATLAFLDSHIAERGVNAETIPYTVEQIRDLFLQKLVIDYDYEIRRASSREREGQCVSIWVGVVSLKKKQNEITKKSKTQNHTQDNI